MTPTLIALAAMLLLIALEVPIAVALLLTGVVGFLGVVGWDPTLFMVGESAFSTVNSYTLTVVPLFILMGNLINEADISRELYRATYRFVGHLRGGLAIATVLACAAFAAICGSSLATSAAMTRVAYPEMKRYGYSDALSTGSIASAGTLGIMIPPSVALMIYGIMTQTDIGMLFIAGVLPGLLGALLYVGAVLFYTWRHPQSAPPGERSTWRERWEALRGVSSVAVLFGLVIGGLYGGWFTPTEAAGVGAAGAFAIVAVRGKLSRAMLAKVLRETAITSGSLFIILIGALVLSKYITVSGFSPWLSGAFQGLDLTSMQFLLIVCAMYIVLGCFLESMSMLLLTLPIVFPLVVSYGIDPVWFGILIVTLIEVALITPPVGMNVYMLASQIPSVPLNVVFRGTSTFVVADVIRLGILLAVPSIALWLPSIT
jgi:tripartite ATP-independent transporter DctM subunit